MGNAILERMLSDFDISVETECDLMFILTHAVWWIWLHTELYLLDFFPSDNWGFGDNSKKLIMFSISLSPVFDALLLLMWKRPWVLFALW